MLQRTCISLGYFAVRNRTNYLMSAKRNALKEYEEDHRLQGKTEEFVHRKDREQECPGGSGQQKGNATVYNSPDVLIRLARLGVLCPPLGLRESRAPELTVTPRSTEEGSSQDGTPVPEGESTQGEQKPTSTSRGLTGDLSENSFCVRGMGSRLLQARSRCKVKQGIRLC